MNDPKQISFNINKLVDGWCERRNLKPLRYILKSYPISNGLTDEWGALLESLKDIKGLCQNDLNDEEKKLLVETINAVDDIVHR